MLILCTECKLQVSDKAIACPHCGCPVKETAAKRIQRRKNHKHRKLPNGFGSITKITGKYLRKPYRAMVSAGKNESGRPIMKMLKPEAYFETYHDAYAALLEYNKKANGIYTIMTAKDVYDKWSAEYFERVSASAQRSTQMAWRYCSSIYDLPISDIKIKHVKDCMKHGTYEHNGEIRTPTPNIIKRMKILFNQMFDYAIEYEIIEKNIVKNMNLSNVLNPNDEICQTKHIPYYDEEMDTLWKNIDTVDYVDLIIFQCYTGWRPTELSLLTIENVDLEKWVIRGGIKTKAGKNRVVPIHPSIREITKHFYEQALKIGSTRLINCVESHDTQLTLKKYSYRLNKIKDQLHLNQAHRPHDGRKHFVTMAKKYKVDEYAIKYIVGHQITDITEKIYTERDIEWLHEEIKKIK